MRLLRTAVACTAVATALTATAAFAQWTPPVGPGFGGSYGYGYAPGYAGAGVPYGAAAQGAPYGMVGGPYYTPGYGPYGPSAYSPYTPYGVAPSPYGGYGVDPYLSYGGGVASPYAPYAMPPSPYGGYGVDPYLGYQGTADSAWASAYGAPGAAPMPPGYSAVAAPPAYGAGAPPQFPGAPPVANYPGQVPPGAVTAATSGMAGPAAGPLAGPSGVPSASAAPGTNAPPLPTAGGVATDTIRFTEQGDGNWAFNPTPVRIPVNTPITWVNSSSMIIQVASEDNSTFDSGALAPGESFSYTPTLVGSITYRDKLHPWVRGTLVAVSQ